MYSLVQTLHTLYKSISSKCKFPLLTLKFTKFLTSSFKQKVRFYSNFASLFIVMRHNTFVLFHLNLHLLWSKGAHQNENFQIFDCLHENQYLISFFKSGVSFLLNFVLLFSVVKHNSSEIF